jgi:predicted nucleic acid-binding protein
MEGAADLVEKHRLRVADAVQLAAALRTSDALARVKLATPLLFVSDDLAQCRAAEAEGLEVLRPAA